MSSALDLDLGRLSLAGSPYAQDPAAQQQGYQQQPPQQQPRSNHARTASSLERSNAAAASAADPNNVNNAAAASGSLQPHQVMQPPLHQGPPPQVRLKEPQRRRGIVKFFNSLKGFGFVVDNDPTALGGQEVFCHFSAISGKGGFRSLAEGEEVEYELVQGPKGFQAANLTGPGGRSVVGDPKARMQKPPAYLPLAPFAMPIGAPYLDPYHPAHAQHASMYPASPYTQHVLYVPAAAASMQHSQYAYAPVHLGGAPAGAMPQAGMPPSAMRPPANAPYGAGGAGAVANGGPAGGPASAGGPPTSPSPFAAPQYAAYGSVAPNSLPGAGGMNGAERYSAASPLGRPAVGGGPDSFAGSPQPGAYGGGAPEYLQQPHQQQRSGSAAAAAGAGSVSAPFLPGGGAPIAGAGLGGAGGASAPAPNPAAFSPPGGAFIGLPGSNGGMPAFGGFAPFSPPTFNNAPLYPAPAPAPNQSQPSQQQQYPYPQPQAHTPQPTSAGAQGHNGTISSALFGTAGTPAPIGSRSGTPAAGGRSTPALGNGSLGNDAWKAPPQGAPGSSAGSLYASSNAGDGAHA